MSFHEVKSRTSAAPYLLIRKTMLKPCWIICTPRSGSTYLSSILNNIGMFKPQFSEYLGWKKHKFMTPVDLRSAPPFCKVLHVHLNRIFRQHDYLQDVSHTHELQFMQPRVSHRHYIEECLPGIRFVLLNRKNIVNQAVSYCLTSAISAKHQKSFFQMYSDSTHNEFLKTNVPITDEQLLEHFRVCTAYQHVWDKFIQDAGNVFVLDYEEIENKIGDLFEFIGIPQTHISPEIFKVPVYKAASDHNEAEALRSRLDLLTNSA